MASQGGGVIARLRSNPAILRIIENSSYLAGEQLLKLIGGLVIGILIARHLGVHKFGELSFAIAYTGLFGVIGTLGLNRIAVREIVAAREAGEDPRHIVDTVLCMRLISALGLVLICIGSAWLLDQGSLLLIAILSPMFLFSSLDIIDLWFQSQTLAKHTTSARSLSYLVVMGTRVLLLALGADVMFFALATLLEYMGAALALFIVYRRSKLRLSVGAYDPGLAKRLIGESWSEIIGGFAGMLYIRLDQIMLGNMLDDRAVGIFAVASRLSEAWYFVPIALVASTFPDIVRRRETDPEGYMRAIANLMRILTGLSYLVAIVTTVLAPYVIVMLYGPEFSESATVLTLHIWSGLFMSLGLASGSWIMAEKRTRLGLYRNLCGAAVNIVLNLLLIPIWGPIGASVATLSSLFMAYMLFDFMVPAMREVSRAKWRALLLLR
ncbi:MAG TPA: flippase [Novosphingobium sp.]|nr:flippase [Novosphingobium sp.]